MGKGDIPTKDYFRVSNDWWDALLQTNMQGNVRQCLDYIIRRTYGWQKKEAEIPIMDFVNATGLKKPNVSRALKALKLSLMITVSKNDNNKYLTYSFNKYFEQWKPIVINYGNKKRVILSDNKELSPPITKSYRKRQLAPIIERTIKKQLKNNGNGFSEFWKNYPIKKGKQVAITKWNQLKKKRILPDLEIILKAISDQTKERELKQGENKFVPEWKHPSTWLNQQCWEDECDIETEREKWIKRQAQR